MIDSEKNLNKSSKIRKKFSASTKNEDKEKYKNIGNSYKCRLYVGNLDYKTSLTEFRETFAKFGTIIALNLKPGFAFVEYEKEQEAERAKNELNLKLFNNRIIIIRNARQKDEFETYTSDSSSSSPSSDMVLSVKKKSVDLDDKVTCFFCGKQGHWKKECNERKKFILKKIKRGEIEKDNYKEHIIPKRISRKRSNSRDKYSNERNRKFLHKKQEISSCSRSSSHDRVDSIRKDRIRSCSNSSSLSISIPSDCSACKRIVDEKKNKNKE